MTELNNDSITLPLNTAQIVARILSLDQPTMATLVNAIAPTVPAAGVQLLVSPSLPAANAALGNRRYSHAFAF